MDEMGEPDQQEAPPKTLKEARQMVKELRGEIKGLRLARMRDMEENKRLRELAMTDELTGVLSRRGILFALDQALAASHRHKHPVSILLVDVDDLKQINDRGGHRIGDQALMEIAAAAEKVLRQDDSLGRYGGDEFIVVLPYADAKQATEISERIRQEIEKKGQEGLGYTVSIGVAEFNIHGSDRESLIFKADEASYQAKGGGKNKVVVA